MHLSSKIVTEESWQLQKQLQCYFDHPFQLLHAGLPTSDTMLSLAHHSLLPFLINVHQQSSHSQCLLAYKYLVSISDLCLAAQEQQIQVQVLEYDHKAKTLVHRLKIGQDGSGIIGEESTAIIHLRSYNKLTQVYLLPFSRGEEELLLSRAIHQNFKLLRVIRQFVALESIWKGSFQFQDPLLRHLSDFLYLADVRVVRLVLWVEESSFDRKLLQQVGQLKLPEPWLEKEEYRIKKTEMFRTKAEEHQLVSTFRQQKEEFTTTINNLQRLASIPPQSYDQISIDSLKQLKQEGFIEKTAEIKDLQNYLAKLSIRESTLRERMANCRQEMQELKKKHMGQMLALKKEVGAMQPKEAPRSQGLLFARTRKSTDQRLSKTNITVTDKKTTQLRPPTASQAMPQLARASDNTQPRTVRDAHKTKKDEFKNNEKKVASVVREGGLQMDRRQLREDYQSQMSRIDFQMEKRHDELLRRYEQAARNIRRTMEDNQEMNI